MKKRLDSKYLVALLIWVIMVLIVSIMARRRWGVQFIPSLKAGILYGSVAYCLLIIPTCFRFIRGNKGVIYQDMLASVPLPVTQLGMTNVIEPPVGQIGLGAGPHLIPPWWQRVGEPIDMITADTLTGTMTVVDDENQEAKVTYTGNNNPAPGKYLPNFLRVPKAIAEAYLKAKIEAGIVPYLKTKGLNWAMANLAEVNEDLDEKLLGSSKYLSDPEKEAGRSVGKIVISKIERTKEAEDLARLEKLLKRVREEAAETLRQLPTMDPTYAFTVAAAAAGIPVEVVNANIRGLQGLGGINPVVAGEVAEELLQRGRRGRRNRPPQNPPT